MPPLDLTTVEKTRTKTILMPLNTWNVEKPTSEVTMDTLHSSSLDLFAPQVENTLNSLYSLIAPVLPLQYPYFITCATTAPSGTFEKYNYGYALPYSSESMISTSGCLSCKEEEEEQNNANGYYNQNANAYYEAPEPSAVCTELYEQSAKCENKMTAKNKYAQVIK
mmetsp:Transcript_28913/g.33601  ORF Transcript_28913/g.33601 Transcript_28913/m.33601 type:complete len:166 (+) Transcript_28913:520-1017(+)